MNPVFAQQFDEVVIQHRSLALDALNAARAIHQEMAGCAEWPDHYHQAFEANMERFHHHHDEANRIEQSSLAYLHFAPVARVTRRVRRLYPFKIRVTVADQQRVKALFVQQTDGGFSSLSGYLRYCYYQGLLELINVMAEIKGTKVYPDHRTWFDRVNERITNQLHASQAGWESLRGSHPPLTPYFSFRIRPFVQYFVDALASWDTTMRCPSVRDWSQKRGQRDRQILFLGVDIIALANAIEGTEYGHHDRQ